ncbi:MAG: L-aspartate oxidase [Actinomycetota bacterium]|nr:L-aspartate oxidase [Actinomycetota bacterium]MDD5666328.1 L-aspartate oxidase [Actinomycetota bacterium]
MIPRYLVNFDLEDLPGVGFDLVVVGSGVAGLSTALRAARRFRVALLTKTTLTVTATRIAQGGIASALGADDSPELHFEDTIKAGKGLCEEEAVWTLVREGPRRITELIEEVGAHFDCVDGHLDLTIEGGHSRRRVAHAQGDATGSELEASLTRRLLYNKRLDVFENYYAIDILTLDGRCAGVLGMNAEEGTMNYFRAPAVVLAMGGMGQLYPVTTNPEICTGDGVSMALRAGAEVADLEFLQFHPTSLHLPETPRWLISEALRGEGAVIVDHSGNRIMDGVHPLKDLAPRDTVVNEMVRVMKEQGIDHLLLDATHIPADKLKERFPTIYRHCLEAGVDITQVPIPVSPAAHYMSGGVVTDLHGRTRVKGLYACGEVACTGVHGANRLASNSLLEGLVFSWRIMQELPRAVSEGARELDGLSGLRHRSKRSRLPVEMSLLRRFVQQMMMDCVGFRRSKEGLEEAMEFIAKNLEVLRVEYLNPQGFELQNMITLSALMIRASLLREESRGCHYRVDFPGQAEFWRKHIVFRVEDGEIAHELRAVGALTGAGDGGVGDE